MKKNHMLRTLILSSVLAILAIMLMTPIASAHTSISTSRVVTATSEIPAIPNVNIVVRNHRYAFSQSALQCKIQRSGLCLRITNLTNKVQEVDNLGHFVVVLQPGRVGLISVSTGPGTYPLNLATNNQATLDVVVS